MDQTKLGNEFYIVGGTMRPEAQSYIERSADRELLEHLLAGDFCYVLTSRQMGKSSLMIQTAKSLTKHEIRTIFIDLSLFGTEQDDGAAERWYYGIARYIFRELKINGNIRSWWQEREDITAVQRLIEFFSEIVLASISDKIVIFIDEIDTTISLPFTDDFFAAIRACYNVRPAKTEFERLTFVLLGVASPSDLIKDPKRTPFNIGHAIHLSDFVYEEAKPLAFGLGLDDTRIESILRQILYWTDGHPYLTQKLCQLIATEVSGDISESVIRRIIDKYFLAPEAIREEFNLNFVHDRLTKDKPHSHEILEIFTHIHQGNTIIDNPLSPAHVALKLSGLAVPDGENHLRLRNNIYKQVFSRQWVNKAYQQLNENLVTYKEPSQEILSKISEIETVLSDSTTFSETIHSIADLILDLVPAQRCVIKLLANWDPDRRISDTGMHTVVFRYREKEKTIHVDQLETNRFVDDLILEEVAKRGNDLLVSDIQKDPRIPKSGIFVDSIRSFLAVPLRSNKEIFGLIYTDSFNEGELLAKEHLNILKTVASITSIRIENARLLEDRFERERMERELQLAVEIQQRFQPTAAPIIEGYDFQGISFSCYDIGGDYYDFVQLKNGNVLIALGEVSGKGTAAALLMSTLHASIHVQVSAGASLEELVNSVNQYFTDNTPANRFLTLFIAELNPISGTLKFINAGHSPALVARSNGHIYQLSSGGFPLGILTDTSYERGEITLLNNEVLVIFSDGVVEANNIKDEEFGIERLSLAIVENMDRSAAGIRDKIESALSKFSGTVPANDDITLVIVKRKQT